MCAAALLADVAPHGRVEGISAHNLVEMSRGSHVRVDDRIGGAGW